MNLLRVNRKLKWDSKNEGFDSKKMFDFLTDNIPGLHGSIEIRELPSGHSKLTFLIKIGDREMVMRRSPVGNGGGVTYNMDRKYRTLKALHAVFSLCPMPLAFCGDESILGFQFYVTEKISGLILHKNLPSCLKLSPSDARNLCKRLIDILVNLHSIDYRALGLEIVGQTEGYVSGQVKIWSDRYRDARTPYAPDYERVMAWLRENMPAETVRPAIIHNDFKLDNIVLDTENPLKIIGVLDWEMVAIGDPLMDIGTFLAYWIEPRDPWYMQITRQTPSNICGALTRRELMELYSDRTGISVSDFNFYYCFGLFKISVIAQRFYCRFYRGQIRDHRYLKMPFAVRIFKRMIERVIEGKGLK